MTTNKTTLNLLLTLLMLVLLFSFYYYFLNPLQESEKSLRGSIASSEQEIESIEARLEAMSWGQNAGNEKELLAKLPKSKDIPMLLQLLQEAELTTASTIQSIVFNDFQDNQQLGLPEPEAEPAEQLEEEEDTEDIVEESIEEQPEVPVTELTTADVPDNLQLLTLEVSVMHEDYDQLFQFIREIEQSERIIHIEMVHFELPGEEVEPDQPETAVSTIQLTTFYVED